MKRWTETGFSYSEQFGLVFDAQKSLNTGHKCTVLKVISSDLLCQKVMLFITEMFVIDHKQLGSMINHNIFHATLSD